MKKENKPVLQQKLERSFARFKHHPAVEYGDTQLTYGELDKRTTHIAGRLLDRGLPAETFIGVLMENRLELIAAMIGILRARCVFVPLDTRHPQDRLKLMVLSTGLKVIICDRAGYARWTGEGSEAQEVELILIDDLISEWSATAAGSNIESPHYLPEDKIYIYFTSGSTGTPRAFIGKNIGLLHFILWEIETFGIDRGWRISQLTTPGFDAFLRDVFAPLCAGGTVCIPGSPDIQLNSQTLINWIERSRVNVIHCVPGLFRNFAAAGLKNGVFKNLKYILMSGERIDPSSLVHWYDNFFDGIQLVNLWGTSETTLAKTCYFIQPSDADRPTVPIGKAIKGAQVMVLDENMKPCKELSVGDLYIRTPYRTYGYCNEPELNDELFVRNPFSDRAGDLLHKTGDKGRRLADGNFEFLGRNDRQVKIRGIRIELAEIESLLHRHREVKDAAAAKIALSSDNELLCAYVTLNRDDEEDVDEDAFAPVLGDYLAKKLPDYMVPGKIMVLKEMPRTVNGKIDYSALFDIFKNRKVSYILPRDDIESGLSDIWCDILGLEKISVTQRFFELGGNSLHIMTLISRIHKQFDMRIPLADIFNNATVEEQALLIKAAKKERYDAVTAIEKKEYYRLSPAQRRLYFLYLLDPDSTAYSLPSIMVLEGELQKNKFDSAFKELIERHEGLRTSFTSVADQPVQKVRQHVDFDIAYYEADEEEARAIVSGFIRPFDLEQAPLVRAGLINVAERLHILMVDMHHIATDGVSLRILTGEFMLLYEGTDLPGLRVQYKDYSEWRHNSRQQHAVKLQENYWLNEFSGKLKPVRLPLDYPRPTAQTFAGDRVFLSLAGDRTVRLKEMALKEDVTLYMLSLTAFFVLLYKITGQGDIIIGTDTAGRVHADLQNVIGMFVNTLTLRSSPKPGMSFASFLQETKDRTMKAFDNQDYPFEELVTKVDIERDLSRNPLFDIAFYFFNESVGVESKKETAVTGLTQKGYRNPDQTAKFDLTLFITESRGNLTCGFEYCTQLFRREKIETFSQLYRDIIDKVLENRHMTLEDIDISLHLLSTRKEEVQLDELDF